VVVLSREDGANEVDAVQILEVAADNSKELADEEVNKVVTITMITVEAVVVREVDGDSAGRTTTSRSATAMRLLISSLIGRCWRRSTSIVLRS